MKKQTIVILDDGRTYSGGATVAKVSEEVMERVTGGEDQLLEEYAEVGVDAVTAAECVLEISEVLSGTYRTYGEKVRAIQGILERNKDGIYPPNVKPAWMDGITMEHKNGDRLTITITGFLGKFQAEVVDENGTNLHPGPWLKVLGEGNENWPVLKRGDFLIREEES